MLQAQYKLWYWNNPTKFITLQTTSLHTPPPSPPPPDTHTPHTPIFDPSDIAVGRGNKIISEWYHFWSHFNYVFKYLQKISYHTGSELPGSVHPYNKMWWAIFMLAWASNPTEIKRSCILSLDRVLQFNVKINSKRYHYENTPIQIYWKFHHQNLTVFR